MKQKFKNGLSDFKAFAIKGNVIDLAVGVIIGGAFGKIVTSLVNDIVMPLISLLLGKVDFSDLYVELRPAIETAEEQLAALTLNYGVFIKNIVDFLIIAFSLYLAIKLVTRLRRRTEEVEEAAPPAPPEPTRTEELLEQIRDLMATGTKQ